MDGDILVAIVTGLIFIIGGGIGVGKILGKQRSHDGRLDTVDAKVDVGFKAVNEKVDAGFLKNGEEHHLISRDIGKGNERISRIEGRLNGSQPLP